MTEKKNQTSKILFILHFPPPVHGAAMVGLSIKESLVINESFNCRYINLGLSASLTDIGKNNIAKVFRYFSLLGQLTKLLLTFKPDICYLTIQVYRIGFYKDLPMALLAKVFGIKVVYHFHNKGVSTYQHRFLDNLLYRLVFRNAKVILLSKYLYPDIQKYVPENRVHYCANGIPEEVGSQESGAKSQKPEILFLSNLIESKGVFVLLEACRMLQNIQLPFHCTFVGGIGDINKQQFQDKVQQLNLENCVNYAGKKYGNDKELAFAKADIFVHPSFNDCFPLVLLEAMQHSLPIVSTREGAIPEIIEDGTNGFLVSPKDAKSLAERLEILIKSSELRQQMGEAGRTKYEKEFTLEKFENRLKEILNSL